MIAAWMLYTIAVTVLLFAGASAAEYLARAVRVPARFVWAVSMLAALGLSGRALTRGTETRHDVAPPAAPAASQSIKGLEITGVRTTERWTRVQPAGKIQTFVNTAREATTTVRRAANRLDLARLGVAGLNIARFESWNAALIALCVVASCVAFIWLVGSLIRLHVIKRGLTSELVDEDVVLVSRDVGPAIFGIVRSRIVLPRWVLSLPEPERHIILAHERQHAAAFDPALLCAAAVALALQPWNVALWVLFARLRFALETDCDRRVLDATGDARRYGNLLVAVYERTTPRLLPHVAFVERPSDLERRIRRMTRRPRLLSMASAGAVLAMLVLSTAAWTMSAPVRRVVQETLVSRPRVWQHPVVATGPGAVQRTTSPRPMETVIVSAIAPEVSVTSPELTPPTVMSTVPAPSAMRVPGARSIPVAPQGPCRRTSQRPDASGHVIVGEGVTLNPACTIDGDIVMVALDSSRVLVAWRDTADAGLKGVEYHILTIKDGLVFPNLKWSTAAGHMEARDGGFYFASPSPRIPAVAFGGSVAGFRDIDPAALRFVIRRWEIVMRTSLTWDVLRQLPAAPRCKPSQQTIRVRGVGTAGAKDVQPLIIIDGVVVPADPPPPLADCFIVNGQEILLQGR